MNLTQEIGSPLSRIIIRIAIVYVLISWILGLILTPLQNNFKEALTNSNLSAFISYLIFAVISILTFFVAKKTLKVEIYDYKKIAVVIIGLNIALHILNVVMFQHLSYVYRNISGDTLAGVPWTSYIISVIVESVIIFITSWLILRKPQGSQVTL